MLFTIAISGICTAASEAQNSLGLQSFDDLAPRRAPGMEPRISEGDPRMEPVPASPQATPNRETAAIEEHDVSPLPLAVPLPVPLPPPKLDESVTPISYRESDAAENAEAALENSSPAIDRAKASGPQKTPISPQHRKAKLLPLAPNDEAGTGKSSKSPGGLPSMISVAGSTGFVLGIFLLLVWIVRRKTPQALARLPGEAFEVLGRAPLSSRQQVLLLRCGNKLLLVSITPGGAETLTEIADPPEVDRLSGLCRQSQTGSSSAAFKQIFEQLAPRRPAKSELPQHGDERYEMTAAGYRRGGRAWEDRNA
ncbi:MAG: flagellar biosynthetic protein FliO [Pirellulales bacterium]|nr:flagellar biosynthetic protein FliO [Pirellulales bacterium]